MPTLTTVKSEGLDPSQVSFTGLFFGMLQNGPVELVPSYDLSTSSSQSSYSSMSSGSSSSFSTLSSYSSIIQSTSSSIEQLTSSSRSTFSSISSESSIHTHSSASTQSSSSSGHMQTAQWVRKFGAGGTDAGQSVVIDSGGSAIVTGYFNGHVSFGGTAFITGGGLTNGFVAKYTKYGGSHTWSKYIKNPTGNLKCFGIAADSNNDVFITGYSDAGTLVIDSVSLPVTAPSVILAKLSGSTGAPLWMKVFPTTSALSFGSAVAVDSQDNVVMTGTFYDTISFGGTDFSIGGGQIGVFIAKMYGNSGGHFWSQAYANGEGYDVAVDGNDVVFVTGYFNPDITIGSTTLNRTGSSGDMFLAKFSVDDGDVVYAVNLGSEGTDAGLGIAIDAANDVFVTGFMNADPGFTASDVFIAKFSNNTGGLLFKRQFTNGQANYGYDIAIAHPNDIVVTGFHRSTISFGGPSIVSNGLQDVFLVKLTGGEGNHVWTNHWGGAGADVGYSVSVGPSQEIAVTGLFNNAVNFGITTLYSQGGSDGFILYLS